MFPSGRCSCYVLSFLPRDNQSGDPQPVTAALFQSCLHYTLLARIAPCWNKAGQWLIQGRSYAFMSIKKTGFLFQYNVQVSNHKTLTYFQVEIFSRMKDILTLSVSSFNVLIRYLHIFPCLFGVIHVSLALVNQRWTWWSAMVRFTCLLSLPPSGFQHYR